MWHGKLCLEGRARPEGVALPKGARGILGRQTGGMARPSGAAKTEYKIGGLRHGRGSQVVGP